MKYALLSTVIFAVISSQAYAAAPRAHLTTPTASESVGEVATTVRHIDQENAVIRTHEDLIRHLNSNVASPINTLAAPARKQFLSSLVFRNGGLASYSRVGLERASIQNVYKILSLFGLQSDISIVSQSLPNNELEESMMFVGKLYTGLGNPGDKAKDRYCRVQAGQDARCVYEYGSNCNDKCSGK